MCRVSDSGAGPSCRAAGGEGRPAGWGGRRGGRNEKGSTIPGEGFVEPSFLVELRGIEPLASRVRF